MKLVSFLVFLDVFAWTLFAEQPFGKQFLEEHIVLSFIGWIACGFVVITLCLVADGKANVIREFFHPTRTLLRPVRRP